MSFFDTPFKKYSLEDESKFFKTCSIRLILTNACNMRCWYCNFNSVNQDKKIHFVTDYLWKKIIEYIDAQEKEKVNFMFTGGEATIHPKFKEYVNELHEHYGARVKIQLNTNLGKSLEFFRNDFKEIELDILASYHTSYVKNEEDFFNKVNVLNKKHNIRIHLMLEKNNIDEIKRIYLKYKNKFFCGSPVYVVPIHEFENDDDFKEIDWYEEDNSHIVYTKVIGDTPSIIPVMDNYLDYRNFKGMLCTGENIIDPNGNIYHCYQDIQQKKVKTNILKDKIIRQADVSICQSTHCYDGVFFPKYSRDTYIDIIKGQKDGSCKV